MDHVREHIGHAIQTGSLPIATATTAAATTLVAMVAQSDWQGLAVLIASVGSMLALVIDRYYRARKESGSLELELLQREIVALREQLERAREDRRESADLLKASLQHHGSGEWSPPAPASKPSESSPKSSKSHSKRSESKE